ncbi:MAG: hypothetical protein RL380_1625 [Verrucomicrobiota bacterium]|jgi:TonB family protein
MSAPHQGENVSSPGRLSSDLARLCLPQAMSDDTRKLAYANSLCVLFLVIGAIGLNPPRLVRHEVSASSDNVPVIFTPPDEAPAPEQPKTDEASPSDAPSEAPQVAVVVAASSANVAFAVPVQGSVIVAASPQFVSGPATTHASKPTGNGPVVFSGDGEASGTFPKPDWPIEERKARHEGGVTLHAIIAEDGTIAEISVRDSSGFGSLDRHTLNFVKRNWQFPSGVRRDYYIPFEFRFGEK